MRGAALQACLSVVPGVGHVAIDRCLKGALVFVVFTGLLNAALVAPAAFDAGAARPLRFAFGAAAAFLWVYAVADVLRVAVWRRRKVVSRAKEGHFRDGLEFYLRGDLAAARAEFKRVLALDRDDPDGWFHLGMAYREMGRNAKARSCLKKSLSVDEHRKWEFEVHRELEAMRHPKRHHPRPQ